MINNWFTVKVKYTKKLDNGALKRVSEPYLLAAMTFTDAEARIYEELGQIIRGEFNVVGISRTEIHDIFSYDDADVWYKVVVKYESADADSEKARKVKQNFLVSAASVEEAYQRIKESLSTLLVDFKIPSIKVSPIVEIFPYNEELDKEIARGKEQMITREWLSKVHDGLSDSEIESLYMFIQKQTTITYQSCYINLENGSSETYNLWLEASLEAILDEQPIVENSDDEEETESE